MICLDENFSTPKAILTLKGKMFFKLELKYLFKI